MSNPEARGFCSCGWRGGWRTTQTDAALDVKKHCEETGHEDQASIDATYPEGRVAKERPYPDWQTQLDRTTRYSSLHGEWRAVLNKQERPMRHVATRLARRLDDLERMVLEMDHYLWDDLVDKNTPDEVVARWRAAIERVKEGRE